MSVGCAVLHRNSTSTLYSHFSNDCDGFCYISNCCNVRPDSCHSYKSRDDSQNTTKAKAFKLHQPHYYRYRNRFQDFGSCLHSCETSSEAAKLCKLKSLRSYMLSHDYRFCEEKLKYPSLGMSTRQRMRVGEHTALPIKCGGQSVLAQPKTANNKKKATLQIKGQVIMPFALPGSSIHPDEQYEFVRFMPQINAVIQSEGFVYTTITSSFFLNMNPSRGEMSLYAATHGLAVNCRITRKEIRTIFSAHKCRSCVPHLAVWNRIHVDSQKSLTALLSQPPLDAKYRSSVARSTVQKHAVFAEWSHWSTRDCQQFSLHSHDVVIQTTPLSVTDWKKEWSNQGLVLTDGPISEFVSMDMPNKVLRYLCELHKIENTTRSSKKSLVEALKSHSCGTSNCLRHYNVVKGINRSSENQEDRFPPLPLSEEEKKKFVERFCNSMTPDQFEEYGCACCGQLTPKSVCYPLNPDLPELRHLQTAAPFEPLVNRQERKDDTGPIVAPLGPILDKNCSHICKTCLESLRDGRIPRLSLANGLWLGDVPDELKGLTYAEKLLIPRVRSNKTVVRISKSRMCYMKGNAISFPNPTPKIYSKLPPPRTEVEEVLAIVFVGHCKPTEEDLSRTPMLVRRNKVWNALTWLKNNNLDYQDVEISKENMETFEDNSAPVSIEYVPSKADGNADPQASAVNDQELDVGTLDGPCLFTVQGVTESDLKSMTSEDFRIQALAHLATGNPVLAVGHKDEAESLYKNPQLYPRMFPWLFPYGYGGINNGRRLHALDVKAKTRNVSEEEHLRFFLMYHDKRFQKDEQFPLIAFNHQQIKNSTTAGHIVAKQPMFASIVEKLQSLNVDSLAELAMKSKRGPVKPETQSEKDCYDAVSDLDHVAFKVQGSITSKKYMRNEVWSLISHYGAPLWFITFAPADTLHPLSLYFADTNQVYQPLVYTQEQRDRLIAENPVASARFFHKTVEMFVLHVLGVKSTHEGIFGQTKAYYGTVEQQGRLTLHLHLLLWIKSALNPQQIREKLMDPASEFQKAMLAYLEDRHTGDLFDQSVDEDLRKQIKSGSVENPSTVFPGKADEPCKIRCGSCLRCKMSASWWKRVFEPTVDKLLTLCNFHSCRYSPKCTANSCAARTPHELRNNSTVDPETGYIHMKHGQTHMNTVNPLMTFVLRCNSDVSCLLSGTAVKAVVAYVTDYITKPGLKIYSIFDSIRSVLLKRSETLGGTQSGKESGRKLITQIVNQLTARMELGAPFAAAYLLKYPDHYTSHTFVPFFWRQYAKFVEQTSQEGSNCQVIPDNDTKVCLIVDDLGEVKSYNRVSDYSFRPTTYANVTLYTWVRSTVVKPIPKKLGKEAIQLLREGSETQIDLAKKTSPRLATLLNNMFACGHPRRFTHYVAWKEADDSVVANVLGGALPRNDNGDHDFYSMVMLTLFKPWRSGQDLKGSNQSWGDAFAKHPFDSRQRELMANFQVRYECNDARDDFSAKKKNRLEWSNDEMLDKLSELQDMQDNMEEILEMGPNGCEVLMGMGKKTLSKHHQMKEMEKFLTQSGWMNQSPNGSADLVNVSNFEKGTDPGFWKNAVTLAKEMRLKLKQSNFWKKMDNRNGPCFQELVNDVMEIDNESYLEEKGPRLTASESDLISETVEEFNLNKEQERAFRIVANHASMTKPKQLKMYLGGMGGTGKSQVIKALIRFFEKRDEGHRFQVVAPTGAAAALVNGSTYHSCLNIRDDDGTYDDNVMSDIKTRSKLKGVDYIFLDEVSMISCQDMYKIASKLSALASDQNVPFGGVNIIVAGDFAQLPPVRATHNLYSNNVGLDRASSTTKSGIESSMGKGLWHQFTTVVILRQNMRQTQMSPADLKFRSALENMRYSACTSDDISFLETLKASNSSIMHKLSSKDFRNVSIITALNGQRDQINEMGTRRFAEEYQLPLMEFYSDDRWPNHNRGRPTKLSKIKGNLDPRIKDMLWKIPHSSSGQRAGILRLCKGLPVMIKYNVATECCVTNGAEAHVVDWIAYKGVDGKDHLETLFVKLANPPQDITLPGLPLNVVPIHSESSVVTCSLPNDDTVKISRCQVPVLPNFAMMDYNSQGRSRPFNVVNLSHCRSHQSIYTCLSRGTSASGTVILGGFSPTKVTGGCTGHLRQEFRELEMLDEITRLRYEGSLPSTVNSHRRNTLLKQFQSKFGESYVPANVHSAVRWNSNSDWNLNTEFVEFSLRDSASNRKRKDQPKSTDCNLNIQHPNKRPKLIKPSALLEPGKCTKRKHGEDCKTIDHPTKKSKTRDKPTDGDFYEGPRWDEANWSCSYDVLLYIFANIWKTAEPNWQNRVGNLNSFASSLTKCFSGQRVCESSVLKARFAWRKHLFRNYPNEFPMGPNLASVKDAAYHTFTDHKKPFLKEEYRCERCLTRFRARNPRNQGCVLLQPNWIPKGKAAISTQEWIDRSVFGIGETQYRCRTSRCDGKMTRVVTPGRPPPILILEQNTPFNLHINESIQWKQVYTSVGGDQTPAVKLKLRGVVYTGDRHFAATYVDSSEGTGRFCDGMKDEARARTVWSSAGNDDTQSLLEEDGKRAYLLLYVET